MKENRDRVSKAKGSLGCAWQTTGATHHKANKRCGAARPGTRKQPSPGQGVPAEVRPIRAGAGNRSVDPISGPNAPSPSEGPSNKRRERQKTRER